MHRPNPRLVGQRVMIADAPALEFLHDEADALFHLLLVGIPSLLDIGYWDAMCTEKNFYLILQHPRASIKP